MSRFILKYRWIIISAFMLTGIFFIALIPFARTDPDMRNYIPRSLVSRAETDSIESVFGFQDMMLILYHDSNSVVTQDNLLKIRELEEKLSNISGISSIISPFSIKTIRGEDGMMVAERLVGKIPANRKEEENLISRLSINNYSSGIVFSSDLRTAAITLTLSDNTSEPKLLEQIDSIIVSTGASGKIMQGGLPAVRKFIMIDVKKDAFMIIPAALLIMLIVLRLTMGSWKSVWIPFSVVVLSTGISIGLIPLLGWELSIISLLVPVILIAVANNYGIYLVNYYNHIKSRNNFNEHDLVKNVLESLRMPILFSGFTTIAGIIGLLTHSVIPAKQVGILASIGVAVALLMSLYMVPALLSVNIFPEKKHNESRNDITIVNRLFERLTMIIIRNPGKLLIISVIIILTFASGIFFLTTDTNQEHFFPEKHPLRKTSDIINFSFGGSQTLSLMISGDIKDPEIMHSIDRITRRIESEQGVGKVFSISQALREMTRALFEKGEDGYDRIPDSKEAIAQMFELYYMSGDADDFKQLINPENDRAHILVRLSRPDRDVIKRITAIINEEKDRIPVKINYGGYALIMYEFSGLLVKGQIFSLVFALVTVFILLTIIFKSLSGGLIGSIPLFASVIILFGFMGFSRIAIDPATALLSSIMIGVGVDFAIQYMWMFNKEFMLCSDYKIATERTMTSIGNSIVINACTVMSGFAVLVFSGFISIKFFGYLVVISIASCLAGSLIVIPAFIIKFKPKFITRRINGKITTEHEKGDLHFPSAIGKHIGPAA